MAGGSRFGAFMDGSRHFQAAAIADLLPTQMTVGLREVGIKRERWRQRTPERAANYLTTHSVPIVVGPQGRHYIIDRHHLIRALHDEGVKDLVISIVADMTEFGDDEFWGELEGRSWAHPFDGEGRRREYREIPKSVGELADDPLRSLAGALKRSGGYVKDKAPFSEFRWADFLRSRISSEMVKSDFDGALARAMNLAPSLEAVGLPGWRGSLPHAMISTVQTTS